MQQTTLERRIFFLTTQQVTQLKDSKVRKNIVEIFITDYLIVNKNETQVNRLFFKYYFYYCSNIYWYLRIEMYEAQDRHQPTHH